jgi:adenylate kinase
MLLFGPPGCGKGTQAAYLAGRFHIPAISTGEMFRAEIKSGTELGKTVSGIISKGGLVSDGLVDDIVASRISQPDCAGGFLLDGYPRTVPQARVFGALLNQRYLPDPIVIHLDVPAEALVARITARRQCPECRRIYNLLSQPPRIDGQCDDDHAPLLIRDDDCEAVIRRRLKAYQELTGPILQFYGSSMVHTVDGSQSMTGVRTAIESAVVAAVQAADSLSTPTV